MFGASIDDPWIDVQLYKKDGTLSLAITHLYANLKLKTEVEE